jgi:hypothetical protein
MDSKKTPEFLEIPVPRFFRENNADKIEKRDQLVEKLMKQSGMNYCEVE